MIAFEGFAQMILNFLRIPPGTSLRKRDKTTKNESNNEFMEHELIKTIVDITADDVCLGNSPLYYTGGDESINDKVDDVFKQFNKIIKWVAVDLLKTGYSIYKTQVIDGKFVIIPYVGDVTFFLDKKNKVNVYDEEDKLLNSHLIFLNYEKGSLQKVEAEGDGVKNGTLYQINPVSIQLKNIGNLIKDLTVTERALLRYRFQTSRIVRFFNVDIGISQGDVQQETVDAISSAFNADSMSLTPMNDYMNFDDTIPVLPNRKGVGKPELTQEIPEVNIDKLADLEYIMSKIFLQTRFPKTYADFSTNIDSTAASTIRGDVRYARVVSYARTKIEDTINDYLDEIPILKKYEVKAKLVELPTPEDEDVVAAMSTYQDFLNQFYDFVFENGESTREQALNKLALYRDLIGASASQKQLQKFFQTAEDFIKSEDFNKAEEFEESEESDDFGGGDFTPSGNDSPEGFDDTEPGNEETETEPEGDYIKEAEEVETDGL